MSTPAVRLLDSAAGIVVLLLLVIAVVGGQSRIYVRAPGITDVEAQSQLPTSRPASLPFVGREADLSEYIMSVELTSPAIDLLREFRLREAYDDRPALIDD